MCLVKNLNWKPMTGLCHTFIPANQKPSPRVERWVELFGCKVVFKRVQSNTVDVLSRLNCVASILGPYSEFPYILGEYSDV